MTHERKLDEASIVAVGNFNPRIFHPEWFLRHELLRQSEVREAVEAESFVLVSQLANFETNWLVIRVTQERFVARAKDRSKFRMLRDLVVGVFEILDETPVRVVGLNRRVDYEVGSPEEWSAIAEALAPRAVWEEIVDEASMDGLRLSARPRSEGIERFRFRVEPSSRLSGHGVHFNFNEEHNIAGDSIELSDEESEFMWIPKLILAHWDDALDNFSRVADDLLDKILGEEQ